MMKSYFPLVASLCLLGAGASAQERIEGGGEAISAQQARDDVRILGTLAQLQLGTEQIARIIPHLEQIQTHLTVIADRRARAYTQQQAALQTTRSALIQGETLRENAYDSIQRALRQLQLATQVEMQRVRQEEANVEAELTEAQLARIETSEQREARLARVRELEGEATAAAYIVKKLREIRELLPDEYARVRLRVANEIAVKTEGPRSSRFNAYRQRALALMDQAYGWTVADFQGKLSTLEQSVARHLEIRPEADAPSAEGLIPYEEYAAVLRNPRTVELLREALNRRGGGMGE